MRGKRLWCFLSVYSCPGFSGPGKPYPGSFTVLKKTRIAGAVLAIATGFLMMAAPASADAPKTVNQTNNLVPITACDNQVNVTVLGVAVPITGVLSPKKVDCTTATTVQAGK